MRGNETLIDYSATKGALLALTYSRQLCCTGAGLDSADTRDHGRGAGRIFRRAYAFRARGPTRRNRAVLRVFRSGEVPPSVVRRFPADRSRDGTTSSGPATVARDGSFSQGFCIGLGLLLTQCPANRDGIPGQLAQTMDETVNLRAAAPLPSTSDYSDAQRISLPACRSRMPAMNW